VFTKILANPVSDSFTSFAGVVVPAGDPPVGLVVDEADLGNHGWHVRRPQEPEGLLQQPVPAPDGKAKFLM
jgi:hypothetical protein